MPVPSAFGVYAPPRGGAPPTVTTLNPLDKSPGITLSGGNLTATRNAASAPPRWVSVRGTTSKSTGKWYFEATCVNSTGGSSDVDVGFANGVFDLDDGASQCVLGFDPAGDSVGIEAGTGTIRFAGPVVATDVSWGPGVGQVCVDLGARRFWARASGGNWNGSGAANPATGVGGVSLTAGLATGAVYPAASVFTVLTPDVITVNFGGSAFVGAIPAGFAAWG